MAAAMPSRPRRARAFHSPRYKALLKLLRQARIEAGLSQVDVAALMRRPQSFVSKSEVGERRVDAIELEEFARIYKKPVTYFLRSR
jgi:transcriptional regulator with XRE-family HTH domain